MVRLYARISVLAAHVWLNDDKALNNHRLLLIVRGARCQRGLIKVRLREVEAECAENGGESEDEKPARLGRAPREDGANNSHARRNAECKRGQREARGQPDADEPGECEGNEGRCHTLILSPLGA